MAVLDTAAADWWRARCCRTQAVGLVPASHLARLLPGEAACRVLQCCSLAAAQLDRDQVVVAARAALQVGRDT